MTVLQASVLDGPQNYYTKPKVPQTFKELALPFLTFHLREGHPVILDTEDPSRPLAVSPLFIPILMVSFCSVQDPVMLHPSTLLPDSL